MVKTLHLKGAPVTAGVINSVAKSFIITNDRSLLIENGGYISLSHQWRRNVLYRMKQEGKKLCRRKATTEKMLVNPGLLKEANLHFQRQIKQMEEWHQIPDYLIINFDQIPLSYVCSPRHTLHFKGVKSVPLGILLPMQLIYQGKTNRCHPAGIEFPEGFNIIHAKNHWSNEDKVIEHLESIIFPFATSKRVKLDFSEKQKCMLTFDGFKVPNVFLI